MVRSVLFTRSVALPSLSVNVRVRPCGNCAGSSVNTYCPGSKVSPAGVRVTSVRESATSTISPLVASTLTVPATFSPALPLRETDTMFFMSTVNLIAAMTFLNESSVPAVAATPTRAAGSRFRPPATSFCSAGTETVRTLSLAALTDAAGYAAKNFVAAEETAPLKVADLVPAPLSNARTAFSDPASSNTAISSPASHSTERPST